jgi:hypothetical protein
MLPILLSFIYLFVSFFLFWFVLGCRFNSHFIDLWLCLNLPLAVSSPSFPPGSSSSTVPSDAIEGIARF